MQQQGYMQCYCLEDFFAVSALFSGSENFILPNLK